MTIPLEPTVDIAIVALDFDLKVVDVVSDSGACHCRVEFI
jgi:hypothetical protein